MKCDNCPLLIVENRGESTMYPDEYCVFRDEYILDIDGDGCHIPWIKVQKILRECGR